jgi:hypothetical protein
MKTFDVDDYLKTAGVEVVIKGKKYVVKDFPMDFDENMDNKEFLSKVIGCEKKELDGYGATALLKLYDYLYTNLVPKNFQNPLLDGSKN